MIEGEIVFRLNHDLVFCEISKLPAQTITDCDIIVAQYSAYEFFFKLTNVLL